MGQSPFAPNTVARRVTWLALLVSAACSGSSAPPALPARSKPPCEVAAELRAIVPRLLNAGKLHRTGRIIDKANRLCATTAAQTWAAELSVSTALGRYANARKLMATIEASPGASEEARAAAQAAAARLARFDKAWPPEEKITPEARLAHEVADRAAAEGKREEAIVLYEKAWEAWPSDGRALMSAGLLAKQLGRTGDAQRLFDRATAVLETATGATISADVPKAPPRASDVVWSRDGKAAALVQMDTISILDTASWRPHLRLQGHGYIVGAAFSPDGSRITMVAHDASVRVWAVPSGAPIGAFQAPGSDVNAVAFSPRGESVALGVSDGTVRLVDAVSGALVRTLGPVRARPQPASPEPQPVFSVAFSPDGNVIAAGMTEERVVRLWDATTGALRLELAEPRMIEQPSAGVESVAFSSDGKRVTGGSIVWDSTTGAPLYRLEEYDPQVPARVVFSPDGKRIAAEIPGKDMIMLWDGPTGDPRRVLPGSASAFSFSPDGKLLATAAGGGNLQLWDVETGVPVRSRGGSAPAIGVLAFSPATKRVASGLADGTVQIWRADTGASHVLRGHTAWVSAIAFSADGERVASASGDTTVRLWDAATGAPLRTLHGHTGAVDTVVFSPDGDRLASASRDQTARLWDPRTGALVAVLGGAIGVAPGVAFSADGKRIATSSNNTLRLWDAATGALRDEQKSSAVVLSRVALSPDGHSIASVIGNTVRVMNSVEGPVLMTLDGYSQMVNDVAFSPDGTSIASAVAGGTVELRDAETGAALATLGGHQSKVIALAFSPASPILWSGSSDGEIRLWRLPNDSPIATLGAVAGKRAAYYVGPAGAVDFAGADACAARDLAVCRIGPHVFPFDVCEERFYSPGLFGKILAGDPDSPDSDPEIEPVLLSCPIAPDVAPPPFTAPPIPRRTACRPPLLPNPKGVLSPGDLEGPYHSREGPRTPDLEDGATTTPLLLGFDAKRGRGAAIVIDEIATAGEGCPRDVRGEVFDLRTGRVLSSVALGKGGSCKALEQATARYAAALPKQGFSPARELVDRVTQRYANDAFAPLAVLDSPLCGWMIHVKANEAQRRFTVALVSPANDKRHELGSLPFGDACMFYDEQKRCALRGEYRHPIVHQVALTPDRSRLYVSIGATRGGHNDPIRFHRGVYLLPRGVLSRENGASR